MKAILLSTAAFLMAGAASGCFYEAIVLRRIHAQGMVLALSDFSFEIIYAAMFGAIGCLVGLLVGLMFFWLMRRSGAATAPH